MSPEELAGRLTVSVPEAGNVLGIGKDASYAAAARGEIPTLRLGRTLRVPVPALLRLLGAGPDLQVTHDVSPDDAHRDLRRVADATPANAPAPARPPVAALIRPGRAVGGDAA